MLRRVRATIASYRGDSWIVAGPWEMFIDSSLNPRGSGRSRFWKRSNRRRIFWGGRPSRRGAHGRWASRRRGLIRERSARVDLEIVGVPLS